MSDSSLSLVNYFPLIPKVHKMAIVSVAIHTDNRFICSLLDKDFCAVQKKQKKKTKKIHFKIQHEFSDRCSKRGIYTLPGGVVG